MDVEMETKRESVVVAKGPKSLPSGEFLGGGYIPN